MSTAVHGVHELWLGAALDLRWNNEPDGDAGTRAPFWSGNARHCYQSCCKLYTALSGTLNRPPYLRNGHRRHINNVRRTCRQRHPSHKRHPSRALVWARTISRRPALASSSFSSALRRLSFTIVKTRIVPVEAELHSGHSSQVCFAAQPKNKAQVRARQQQDGACPRWSNKTILL